MKAILLLSLALSFALLGCGSPSAANIQLRKQNQELNDRVTQLQRDLAGANASIRALERRATTLPTLPQDRLAKLFTTHGLKLGRMSGEVDLDPAHPGTRGLKIAVSPVDQYGQALKA